MAGPCLLSQVTNAQFEKQIKPEERAHFWNYAKSLGANQGIDHATVISQMAKTFNMPERLMAQALDGPKTIRKASEEVRARQRASQQFIASNKRYLEKLDQTGAQRLVNFLNDGTRSTLLAYHGPVPPVTHAIDISMTNPVKFLQMYGRAFKSLSQPAYEKMMGALENEKYYGDLKKAGMPLGREAHAGFGKTGWAGRSMDSALGWLRYKLAEAWIDRFPAEQRTPELFKQAALEYSHATGALVKGEPIERAVRGFFSKIALAPWLTPSKIMKSVVDPATTIKTIERMIESKVPGSRVRPPTPEERSIAFNRIWRAGRWIAPTLIALNANDALLKAMHSNQKVNLRDPTKSDYLGLKFGGKVYRMRGTLEIAALVAKLASLYSQTTGKDRPETGFHKFLRTDVPGFGGIPEKGKFGGESGEEASFKYGEYKLTPGIGLGKELFTGKDVFGRPVPWSKDPGSARFPRKNVMEFVGEHGPIFVGHAVSALHESLRDHGVDTRTSGEVIRALTRNPVAAQAAIKEAALAGGAEFFGLNIQPDRYIGK